MLHRHQVENRTRNNKKVQIQNRANDKMSSLKKKGKLEHDGMLCEKKGKKRIKIEKRTMTVEISESTK